MTKRQQKDDAATKASLDYLAVLERRLRITWTAEGEPVFVPNRASRALISALKSELNDLLTGSIRDASINATCDYGRNRVQTVGFGVADDFDQLVKLGFLYGQRLVLWDLIGSRLLVKKDLTEDDLMAVGAAACDLLLLRTVVEDGGVVILPPPEMWSKLARLVASDLRERVGTTTSSYGLSMALSTVEDGLQLHPFTLLNERERLLTHEALTQPAEEFYAKGNQHLHGSLAELLADRRLVFLRTSPAKEFYRVTKRFPELQREIGEIFSESRSGLSKVQLREDDQKRIDDIAAAFERRNAACNKYIVDGLETTAGLTAAALLALASGRFEGEVWLMAATLGDLSVKLLSSLRKWYTTPKPPIIIQAFRSIQSDSDRVRISEELDTLRTNSTNSPAQTEKNWEKFIQNDWIEIRHRNLIKRPLHEVRSVLASLGEQHINKNVNVRRFQEDYISDYLADAWTISKSSYWEHIRLVCRHKDGFILSDDDAYIQPLLAERVPSEIWWAVLWSTTKARAGSVGMVDGNYASAEIIRAQTSLAEDGVIRRSELAEWYMALDDQEVQVVQSTLKLAFEGEIPAWLESSRAHRASRAEEESNT